MAFDKGDNRKQTVNGKKIAECNTLGNRKTRKEMIGIQACFLRNSEMTRILTQIRFRKDRSDQSR